VRAEFERGHCRSTRDGSAGAVFPALVPLFKLEDRSKARVMGSFVLMAGVIAWAALLVVLTLLLSMIVGLR